MKDNRNGLPVRILIAASGTGGHLFPALYIAKGLTETTSRKVEVEFVGSGRPLEEKIIEGNGLRRHVVEITGVKHKGLRGALRFLTLLPGAFKKVWKLVSAFRPDVVVGVGGYASVLPVLIAWVRGIPTWIHECELKPGMANFVLSPFASKISLAFEDAKMPFKGKTVRTGMPVRPGLKEVKEKFVIPETPTHILVMGGSQGAASLDSALAEFAPWFKAKGLKLRHQCRPESVEKMRTAMQMAGYEAVIEDFIDNPVNAYDWAHLIICRSGASSVMEVGAVNKPVIFVPYPFAQANHQLENAKTLGQSGKALVVEEGANFTERLREALEYLLEPKNYRTMLDAPLKGRSATAAQEIALGVLDLCSRKEPEAI